MGLTAGSHILFLTESLHGRLPLIERLVTNAARRGRRLVAFVDPRLSAVFRTAVELAELKSRQVSVQTINPEVDDGGDWQAICESVDASVREIERHSVAWHHDEPETETLVFVDLDIVFERCRAASEMLSVVRTLHARHAAERRCLVEAVSISMVPRSIPTEFFDLHTDWVFASHAIEVAGGEALDRAAHRVALETGEFRQQFLALARTDRESVLRLVPRIFSDYRRGFLVLDRGYQVRHCSSRAADLLGRRPDEIAGRPVSTCIDGVDLVTLRRECARSASGEQSPFIISWRLAPGLYEPREVTIDPVTSEQRTVGFVVSIASVQSVRGPRTAYRQAPGGLDARHAPDTTDDEPDLADESSDSLQGTQITPREHEVLLLILQGRTNRDIAGHLSIAEVTVKKHLTSIYRKLRIGNRSELIQSFAPPRSQPQATSELVE